MSASQEKKSGDWTLLALLKVTQDFFQSRGLESPRLDAELLLAKVLDCDRIQLYTRFDRPLTKQEVDEYRKLVRQRADHVPVHYLVGEREFFSRTFEVTQDVLIPRPETEVLVETFLELAEMQIPEGEELKLADIGTGAGTIAITLACELPQAEILATDISPSALEVARGNAVRLGVDDRVTFLQGDMDEAFPADAAPFTALLSNPPYIPSGEVPGLLPEVGRHEPMLALDGGSDGLEFFRRLAEMAPAHVAPGGFLLVEVGAGQAGQVAEIFQEKGHFQSPAIVNDYAEIPRIVYSEMK